jgi:hypothetical protein|tara:strand:- start:365 stop:541 length:177 start_codon:yes stop_codon:yes gene_type:complete
MDKVHKPSIPRDKTKHDKRSESEKLQDDLEPIWHPTQHDESDEIEDAKKLSDDDRDCL